MKLNKEVNLLDLIKVIILTVGGIIGYILVDKVSAENDRLLLQKQFLDELPDFYPNLKINYTNEFNRMGDTLFIKVFLENKSKYPIWINYPIIKLLNKDTLNKGNYFTINRDQFRGLISPGSTFQMTYINRANAQVHEYASIKFYAALDLHLKRLYGCLFQEVLKDTSTFNTVTQKEYSYQEKTYDYNQNPIWDDFFENPR